MMIDIWLSVYSLFGLFIGTLVELGYDRRRNGDPGFQFIGEDINWRGRILTIVLWPIVVIMAIVIGIRESIDKQK